MVVVQGVGLYNPTHIYEEVGTYNVRLEVFYNNPDGSTVDDSDETTATITPSLPDAEVSVEAGGPYSGIVNRLITMEGSAGFSDPRYPNAQKLFRWDFGDGSFSETLNNGHIRHRYQNTGVYTVVLTVDAIFQGSVVATGSDSTTATINSDRPTGVFGGVLGGSHPLKPIIDASS